MVFERGRRKERLEVPTLTLDLMANESVCFRRIHSRNLPAHDSSLAHQRLFTICANSPMPVKFTCRSIVVEKVLYDGDNTFDWCQGFYTDNMPWTLQRNVELVRP